MNDRCGWCGTEEIYIKYHDTEWGVPDYNARSLWEKLVLDGFQAGLSWITILRKRDSMREEFDGFDPERVAAWDDSRIEKALLNPGIIRHRGKVNAAVKGARVFLEIEGSKGFSPFLWSFVDGKPVQNQPATFQDVPTDTPQSTAMSKELKKRGFNFCGPVITYAFMQATGMVNDHLVTCPRHAQVKSLSSGG